MKDITPTTKTKERIRVQAGREGGPVSSTAASKALVVEGAGGSGQQMALSEPTDFLSLLYRMAIDPRVDVEKMKAGLDMQERIEDREAKKAYNRDFRALQKELPTIDRDGKIEVRAKDQQGQRTGALTQSTPYATYPAIMEIVKPLLDIHGFTLSTIIKPGNEGKIEVVTTLTHDGGHERESNFPLGADTTGSKNNAQGWGSSQQYGMRYNAIALLNIVSKAPQDRCNNGFPGDFKNAKDGAIAEAAEEIPKINAKQLEEIGGLLQWARIADANFCAHYGIARVADLPSNLFASAVTAVKAHHSKQAEKTSG